MKILERMGISVFRRGTTATILTIGKLDIYFLKNLSFLWKPWRSGKVVYWGTFAFEWMRK